MSRLKDLEYDNFRLEKKLSEMTSRMWRVEGLFNNYVFSSVVREKYESSNYYCKGDSNDSSSNSNTRDASNTKKTYFVHFVDYLSVNSFKRIQDAIDVADDNDKIIVHSGIYNESLIINKQISIFANGYVELRSNNQNIVTCCAQNEGCLVKGFTIRRLDGSKTDPTTCGINGVVPAEKGQIDKQ
jgi:hypothetical protein